MKRVSDSVAQLNTYINRPSSTQEGVSASTEITRSSSVQTVDPEPAPVGTDITLPVNGYDPSLVTIKDQIHASIRADLAELGTVKEIRGNIVSTHRSGTVLTDVVAHVEHPRLRTLIVVTVVWDEVFDRLRYYGYDHMEFTPKRESGYGADTRELQDQQIISRVFDRLDRHPAVRNIQPEHPMDLFLAPGAAAGIGMTSSTALTLFTPADTLAIVGLSASLLAGGVWACRKYLSEQLELRRHSQEVENWNENPAKVISDVFSDRHEESQFMDAFYVATGRHELKSIGQLEVSARHEAEYGEFYNMDRVHAPDSWSYSAKEHPFRSYMMTFTARGPWWEGPMRIYWDGRLFFYRASGCPEHTRGTPQFFPLAAPMSSKDKKARIEEIAAVQRARKGSKIGYRDRFQGFIEAANEVAQIISR